MKTGAWKKGEEETLIQLKRAGASLEEMVRIMDRPYGSVRGKIRQLRQQGRMPQVTTIPASPFPIYDKPLHMEGDALVLPDLEVPFHHAEFVNRVVELADAWGIRQCILAGDVLHFENLSAWGANWQPAIGEDQREELLDFVNDLPKKYRQQGLRRLEKIGAVGSPDLDTELATARKTVAALTYAFDEIHYCLGNHDDRYLRTVDRAMQASELLTLLQIKDSRWKIAPYYYSFLTSGGEEFRIEHPNTTAMNAARNLAAKYHKHILMAHSHRWAVERDMSGTLWAIQMGHCVDERRLPYAAQRSTNGAAHCLGAVIVRDGYPWVLSEKTDWERMKRM